jgi:ketosteroid isomerase-like protein
MRLLPPALLAAVALAGCVRNIPDTDIPDTVENRAVLQVVDDYRKAFDRRDVPAVMALVSPEYFDDAGTSVKDDDVDYAHLAAVLADTFARTSQLRLELGVTAIDVKGDRATVDLFYDVRYRVTTPRREIPKRDSDVQRLILRRDGQSWRIASGL